MQKNKGFTIIELLTIIVIIGVLSTIVIAALNEARNKSRDKAIKLELATAKAQMNLFFANNTRSTYHQACDLSMSAYSNGIKGVYDIVLEAAKKSGTSTIELDYVSGTHINPLFTNAICHDGGWTTGLGWAIQVPLNNGKAWCIDSYGRELEVDGITTNLMGLTTDTDRDCY